MGQDIPGPLHALLYEAAVPHPRALGGLAASIEAAAMLPMMQRTTFLSFRFSILA